MEVEWRPLAAGEVLERTFLLYRARFRLFVSIALFAAALCTAWAAWQGWALGELRAETAAFWQGGRSLADLYVALLADAFPLAAITCATAALLQGKPIGVAASYRQVWPRWHCYLRLSLVAAVRVTWPLLIVLVAFAGWEKWMARGAAAAGPWLLLEYLVALPACIWLLCRYALCLTVCVMEEGGVQASLRRAARLSEGLRLKIFLLLLLVYIMLQILGFAALVPVLEAFRHMPAHLPRAAAVYELAAEFFLTLMSMPVYGIGLTVIYMDACLRKDGAAWK
jgi:hypothetical protein